MTTTGIPIEWMFAVLAAMVGGIYLNLLWEVRRLRSESSKRGENIAAMRYTLRAICHKLDLPFGDDDDT